MIHKLHKTTVRLLSQAGRLLGKALYPIWGNALFFIFMFWLGYECTVLEVPHVKGAKPYALAAEELFVDIYFVCLLLIILPKKIRRWCRIALYALLYLTAIIDVYCFVKFNSTLTPTMLLLVSETTGSEAAEFISTYLSWDIIRTEVGTVVMIMLLHILVNTVIASRRRLGSSAMRLRFMAAAYETMRAWMQHHRSRTRPYRVAAQAVAGVAVIWLFIHCWKAVEPNKLAYQRLMGLETIGKVEHELTRPEKAVQYLPIYRLMFSIHANGLAAEQVRKLISAKDEVSVDSCSFRSRNIVLIIGESYNRHHSQIYGYKLPTTPRQAKWERSGRLTKFTDVVAPWNLTSFVFKNVFSVRAVGDEGDWCDYPLFPEVFRKAGYRVTFITNQFLPKAQEAVYDFSGGFFLNNPILSEAQFDVRNTDVHRYDEGILADYDMLKPRMGTEMPDAGGKDSANLIILHLMGQHVSYRDRYPADRMKFTPEDYLERKLSNRDKTILADYDNATLYNDSILDQILQRFSDEDAVVVFMPDHGEECFGNDMHVFGRMHSADIDYRLAHEEFEIPFWIWCSEKYEKRHPETARAIKDAANRPYMTDRLAHTMFFLAGISCPDYRPRYNVLGREYDPECPRIIKGTADYDKLRDEHLRKEQELAAAEAKKNIHKGTKDKKRKKRKK